MNLEIRCLTAADDDAFSSLWHSARGTRLAPTTPAEQSGMPGGPTEPSTASGQLGRPGAFGTGVFEDGDLLAAAVAVPALADDARSSRPVPGLAHIAWVATTPDRWGEGLAGRAVQAVLWTAVQRGYARTQLWTQTTNERAHRLYGREGFQLTGRRMTMPDTGEDLVHYVRDLPTPRLVLGRRAARVLCLDEQDRVLLMHWHHPVSGHRLWEPPGGGIEAGESPREAVLREWREETGLPLPTLVGNPTLVARDQLWGDARFVGDEVFFLGRYDEGAPAAAPAFTLGEQTSYLGQEWVERRDLVGGSCCGDPIEPDVATVLARLAPDGPWGR